MYKLWKYMKQIALVLVLFSATTWAGAVAPQQMVDVTPDDWEYTALQTLYKHGAITDMMGIELDGRTYTRYELTPLIADVVDRRESMNDNDRNTALRLYREYMDDIREYWAAVTKSERGENLERKPMTQEEIDKKMETFTIDDSRVKVSGDVRIRYDKKDGKEKKDSRVRTEFAVPL